MVEYDMKNAKAIPDVPISALIANDQTNNKCKNGKQI